MKNVMFCLIALLMVPRAFANTDLKIEPTWPVFCERHDYPMVNQVSVVQKDFETAETVGFSFHTTVGACSEKRFVQRPMITVEASVSTMRDKIILFQKDSVIKSVAVANSATDATISLVFNKKRAFKKKNRVGYTMAFYPQGRHAPVARTDAWGRTYFYQYPDIQFFWDLDLVKLADNSSSLKVGVRP